MRICGTEQPVQRKFALLDGRIQGLHLAARNPGKVQGVSLFSPTLWINGWAMPWTMRLFKLVRSRWLANCALIPNS